MTDQKLKSTLGFILRNKEQFSEMLDCFKAEDIEKGIIAIPESLINTHLRNVILEQAEKYLTDYSVRFQNDAIYVKVDLSTKQLGPLYAKLLIKIEDLYFDSNNRKLFLSYKEEVKCGGNMLQIAAFKAFGAKGPYTQTAAEMAKLPFLQIRGHNGVIHLGMLRLVTKFPSALTLNYLSCTDGLLRLSFHI